MLLGVWEPSVRTNCRLRNGCGSKHRYQHGTLVSGTVDQSPRNFLALSFSGPSGRASLIPKGSFRVRQREMQILNLQESVAKAQQEPGSPGPEANETHVAVSENRVSREANPKMGNPQTEERDPYSVTSRQFREARGAWLSSFPA